MTEKNRPSDVIEHSCVVCGKVRKTKQFNTLRTTYTGMCDECNRKSHVGKNNPNWKGGKRFNNGEYYAVHCPSHPRAHNGRVLEHILIAEEMLGRFLKDDEVVHHIDGNKKNNKQGNLSVLTQSQHAVLHDIKSNMNKKLYEQGIAKGKIMVAEEIEVLHGKPLVVDENGILHLELPFEKWQALKSQVSKGATQ